MKRNYNGYKTENYDILRSYGGAIGGASVVDGFYVRNKKTFEKHFFTTLKDAKKHLTNIGEKI